LIQRQRQLKPPHGAWLISRALPAGRAEKIIRYGIIITGYSNIIATMYGGIFDARGLMPNPESSIHDLVVFFGFMPGVIAIFFVLGAMAISLRRK
jgi:hypothetical protein